ncbi:MAG: hypothetical protein MnENMB40S_24910 [Rhizobiaceae bacterium MnEN-MB40S]|nr:MAG: hypothetical protein MnENMB40S_24910 [Rhizobiaceae bacterium MnEN-MB40S]
MSRSSKAVGFFLYQHIDEFDGREETNALAVMFGGLDAERGCKMGLPGSGTTEKDGVVSLLDELAVMELTHERLVDFDAGKVEAVQVPLGGKARRLVLTGHRPDFQLNIRC